MNYLFEKISDPKILYGYSFKHDDTSFNVTVNEVKIKPKPEFVSLLGYSKTTLDSTPLLPLDPITLMFHDSTPLEQPIFNIIYLSYDFNGKKYKNIINCIESDATVLSSGLYSKIVSCGIFTMKPFEYEKQINYVSSICKQKMGIYVFIGFLFNSMFPLNTESDIESKSKSSFFNFESMSYFENKYKISLMSTNIFEYKSYSKPNNGHKPFGLNSLSVTTIPSVPSVSSINTSFKPVLSIPSIRTLNNFDTNTDVIVGTIILPTFLIEIIPDIVITKPDDDYVLKLNSFVKEFDIFMNKYESELKKLIGNVHAQYLKINNSQIIELKDSFNFEIYLEQFKRYYALEKKIEKVLINIKHSLLYDFWIHMAKNTSVEPFKNLKVSNISNNIYGITDYHDLNLHEIITKICDYYQMLLKPNTDLVGGSDNITKINYKHKYIKYYTKYMNLKK
jgi:hypothetical protein